MERAVSVYPGLGFEIEHVIPANAAYLGFYIFGTSEYGFADSAGYAW